MLLTVGIDALSYLSTSNQFTLSEFEELAKFIGYITRFGESTWGCIRVCATTLSIDTLLNSTLILCYTLL